MIKGVISAPRKIITGAFNVRFTFQREIELTAADVVVDTLEGDALGHTKDSFGGGGADYHILCYIPDVRKGRSRISVVNPDFDVVSVIVEYDTVRTVGMTFGTPMKRGSKIEIPVSFDTPIQNLTKRNFQVSYPSACQLYGTGDSYSLVIPKARDRFTVTVSGLIQKMNGVQAVVAETVLEVDRG